MNMNIVDMLNVNVSPLNNKISARDKADKLQNFDNIFEGKAPNRNPEKVTKEPEVEKPAKAAKKPTGRIENYSQKPKAKPVEAKTAEAETTEVALEQIQPKQEESPSLDETVSLPEIEIGEKINLLAAELAVIFQVASSEVLELLNQFEFLPGELMDTKKLNELVQRILGVESPVELLNISEISEKFKAAIDAVQGLTEPSSEAEPEPTLIIAQPRGLVLKPLIESETIEASAEFSPERFVPPMRITPTPVEPMSFEATDVVANANTAQTVQAVQASEENSLLPKSNRQNDNPEFVFNMVNIPVNQVKAEQVKTEFVRSLRTEFPDVINQLSDKIRVEVKADNTTEIKMVLKPESLGEVSLKIATQNGIVTAQFIAESQRVKEIIEAGFNQLRDILNQQGINVNALSVSVGQRNDQSGQMNQFMQQASSRRIRQIFESVSLAEVSMNELTREGYLYDSSEVYKTHLNYRA